MYPLACVTWCRVLLLDIVSALNHLLHAGQYYFLQELDVGYHVESLAVWEIEWRLNIAITSEWRHKAVITPKPMILTGGLNTDNSGTWSVINALKYSYWNFRTEF